MKNLTYLFLTGCCCLLFSNLSAQVYTSEVQVVEQANGGLGVGIVPESNLDVLLSGNTTAGRRFRSYGLSGVRLQRFGDADGVAMEYGFLSNDGLTDWGGFGGYGSGTTGLRYLFIGLEYDAPYVTFLPDGKVGIGTTTPSEALHVSGNIRLNKGQTQEALGFKLGWGTEAFISSIMTSTDTDRQGLVFYTHPSSTGTDPAVEAMRITHDGKIGVGIASPAGNLEVTGTSGVYHTRYSEDANAATFFARKARGTSTAPSGVLGGDDLAKFYGAGYTSEGSFSAPVGGMVIYAAETFTSTGTGSYLTLRTTKTGAIASSERLRIDDEGNIGVGVTIPLEKFHVQGASGLDGATPITMRLQSTNSSSSWITDSQYARLDFASSDASGAGVGTKVRLAAITDNTSLSSSGLVIYTTNGATFEEVMRVKGNGNVGIGTASPTQKLEVNGSVKATSFISNTQTYADFVFDESYKLPSLEYVENYIRKHKHLPNVPTEKEVMANGMDLAAMNVILLQKVEELTLYLIEMKRENEEQQKQLDMLLGKVNR